MLRATLAVMMLATLLLPRMAMAGFDCGAIESTPATPEATPTTIGPVSFPDRGDIRVFAAASLTDALGGIATEIMADHPGISISIQTAGSQTLVTQLQEGAPADVLATADSITMNRAVGLGLIDGEPRSFARNRLVIAVPAGNPAGVESIDDLATDGLRLVIANGDVPAGTYTATALCVYAGLDGAPEGFLENVQANVVSKEPNVRNVLAKVQLGEADAGVVYASDVTASNATGAGLEFIEFPSVVPVAAEYRIAPVAGGDTALAEAFMAYVMSEDGAAILAKYGFE